MNIKNITDVLLRIVFEKLPVLRLLSGYKTYIGNILIVVAATLGGLQGGILQVDPAADVSHVAWSIGIIGAVIKVIGELHADTKDRTGTLE